MLRVDSKTRKDLVDKTLAVAKAGAVKPLLFENYMGRVLEERYNNLDPKLKEYPRKILLPKSLDAMLKGDLTSAEDPITITGPLDIDGVPIWFDSSKDKVDIHMGTQNGDSRFPCTECFSDSTIHMLLAGSTGSGKSVALNDLIYAMCLQYAPWEINLVMSDAKIVEFKAYAKGHQLPHISAIAATGDSDYLISVLRYYYNEMIDMNTVYTNAGQGVKNIMDFRETTGICVPRTVLVMDEFQTMFKNATNKQKQEISSMIDGFSRLGRNTGYHLLLCSQELDSNVSKGTLNQIKIRAALGCPGDVSEKILNNDMARYNDGIKGRCIMNTNPSAKDTKPFNKEFRVPFLSGKRVEYYSYGLELLGKKLGYKRPLTFYDETSVIFENDYPDYIYDFEYNPNTLYLGEPAFMTDDFPRVQKIEYTGRDTENIAIVTHVPTSQLRQVKMLAHNISRNKGASNIVLYSDKIFYEESGLEKLSGKMASRLHVPFEQVEGNNMYATGVLRILEDKQIMCRVDNKVFSETAFTDEGDTLFEKCNARYKLNDSKVYRSRCAYVMIELEAQYLKATRKTSIKPEEREDLYPRACVLISRWKNYGINENKALPENMPVCYIWMLGLNKVLGIGRDSKSRACDTLKAAMQDGPKYNMRFIVTTTMLGDGLLFMKNSVRWFIFENTLEKEVNRVAADTYPKAVPPVLGVLYDTEKNDCVKFKKMFFDGEPIKSC